MLMGHVSYFFRRPDFKGRSNRKELFSFLISFSVIFYLYLQIRLLVPGSDLVWQVELLMIYILAPLPALLARRIHDIGCSAWVSLAWLLPFAGLVLCAWMLLEKGEPGENYYGLPPA